MPLIELPNVSRSQYSLIIKSLKAFRDDDNPEEYNEEINSLIDLLFFKYNEGLSNSDQPNWFKDGNLDRYYQIDRG